MGCWESHKSFWGWPHARQMPYHCFITQALPLFFTVTKLGSDQGFSGPLASLLPALRDPSLDHAVDLVTDRSPEQEGVYSVTCSKLWVSQTPELATHIPARYYPINLGAISPAPGSCSSFFSGFIASGTHPSRVPAAIENSFGPGHIPLPIQCVLFCG